MFENVPVIYSYTRAQAIADGELIDVTESAKHEGFKIPVAITRAAYHVAVTEPNREDNKVTEMSEGNSLSGFLDMVHWHISKNRNTDRMEFTFRIGAKLSTFIVVCGPGDDPSPVLTIMLPEDD